MIEISDLDLSALPDFSFLYQDDREKIPPPLQAKLWKWLCNFKGKKLAKSQEFHFERGLLEVGIQHPSNPNHLIQISFNVCRDKSKSIEYLGPLLNIKEINDGKETILKDCSEELSKAFQEGATDTISRMGTYSKDGNHSLQGRNIHSVGLPAGWMGRDPTQAAEILPQSSSMGVQGLRQASDQEIDDEFLDAPTDMETPEELPSPSGMFQSATAITELPDLGEISTALASSFLMVSAEFKILLKAQVGGWQILTVELQDGGEEEADQILDSPIGLKIPEEDRKALNTFRKDLSKPYQTITFDNGGSLMGNFCRRYRTEDEARNGHDEVCRVIARKQA
jgi:hypothetical protein